MPNNSSIPRGFVQVNGDLLYYTAIKRADAAAYGNACGDATRGAEVHIVENRSTGTAVRPRALFQAASPAISLSYSLSRCSVGEDQSPSSTEDRLILGGELRVS